MQTRFLIYFFHFIIPENCSRSQEQEEYGRGSGEPYACGRCLVERRGDPPAPVT